MYAGFWSTLPRPILGLSPMDGVTDQPYRWIQKKYGQPDVIFTEFTSAEGVSHNATKLFRDFLYEASERPVVAQIFGKDPESFRTTALILGYLGFDGIDINMGCPAKTVRQHGSGAALIKTPELAKKLISATQAGVQDWVDGRTLDDVPKLKEKTKKLVLETFEKLPDSYKQRRPLPISVKTRIGYDHPMTEEWISTLLEMEIPVITVHGRTLMQMYTGQANWEEIAKAVELGHQAGTLILGNGDIKDAETAQKRFEETGVDGFLIGRASFGDPSVLQKLRVWRDQKYQHIETPALTQNPLQLAIEHSHQFEKAFPEEGFYPMRKHLAWYVRDFPNASDYRVALMQANNAQEVEQILQPLLASLSEK